MSSTQANGEPRKLSIEERLEKLTERHEALTQSLELASRMMHDNERNFNERFQKNETQLERILGIVEKLAAIAQSHDRRISDLEGQ